MILPYAAASGQSKIRSILCIALASAVTYSVYGYQFGRGNHAVYLLDAIRRFYPPQLAGDWFTTQTLQYHVVFTLLSGLLMRLHLLAPAFAIFYALLIVGLHVAWRGIVIHIGGNDAGYLLSVALYYLSAAGTGLGSYQFLQDSSFLPSNIAAVVMLWGIWLWIIGRPNWSGVCFGVAGIFHLNFALIGIGLWIFLSIKKRSLIGTLLAIVPSAINIALALQSKLVRSRAMPFDQFIDLYVKFRHPHHYDPSSWPIGLWLAFAWTIVPGVLLLKNELRKIFLIFLSLNIIALIGAGFWFLNETLVQMSLYRFSIYVQLFGCIALGAMLRRYWSILACVAIIVAGIFRGPFFGAFVMPHDDAAYISICKWAEQNTPVDAMFLVPPDEEAMRLVGRRAIIINYKAVPQLSAELETWRQRLCDVLDLRDLDSLPRGYAQTLRAVRARYDSLSSIELQNAANKYHARYILATHRLDLDGQLVQSDATGRYFLYDLEHR